MQAAARTRDGKWDSGAVKHGMITYNSYPQVSLLYTTSRYYGSLPEEYAVLKELQTYIAGDEMKGEAVMEYLWEKDGKTTEEIRQIIADETRISA